MANKNTWICTDPDSEQWSKQVNEFEFQYIEARETPWDGFTICSARVDLRDYTVGELAQICSSYYGSAAELIRSYPAEAVLQIIAECVFESFELMEFGACPKAETLEKAERIIAEMRDNLDFCSKTRKESVL